MLLEEGVFAIPLCNAAFELLEVADEVVLALKEVARQLLAQVGQVGSDGGEDGLERRHFKHAFSRIIIVPTPNGCE